MKLPQDPREWEGKAACYRNDDDPVAQQMRDELDIRSITELFYPPRIKSKYHVYADIAKKDCWGPNGRTPCPVRRQCLAWAIHTDEEHGIWGGMSHRERNALVRKTARAAGVRVDPDNLGPAIKTALAHIAEMDG